VQIFISYRQADLGGHASSFVGQLRDRLAIHFGERSVSVDVDIPYGEDFVEYLGAQVAKADVVLAVIGPEWAREMTTRAGDEDDFVRIEIEQALSRAIRVIPILAGGTSMPEAAGLPESILPLRRRNALPVDSGRDFHVHLGRLIEAIEAVTIRAASASPPAIPRLISPSAPPLLRKAGDTETDPHGIELVWCPPGEFWMGGGKSRQVHLSHGFWIGKYPVTQKQWKVVMGSNPSFFKGSFLTGANPDRPVENVSWDGAQKFLGKLGSGYRLPTEAQWEYACWAGSTTAYWFGDDEAQLGDYAWFRENSGGKTHDVGRKKPNAWGIHDMQGNVWEWCQDLWADDLGAGPVTDPVTVGIKNRNRVIRGGSWYNHRGYFRSAMRLRGRAGLRNFALGFRVCLVPLDRGGRGSGRT
jgi:formylglycine-generating enzyme required for sulfatase activity